ncbi:MAG: alginate export family protein [Desulfobacteraceae bacterium]|nr:alginate export family protein [Desulfobacteraceae bacterium]MBC2754310.1 alginate export family protein [Desulfobacteraceae bacterium]
MKRFICLLGWLLIFFLLIFFGHGLAMDLDEDSSELPEDFKSSYSKLVESPNDIDEEDFTECSLFDRPFYLAGEVQFSSEFKGDYELDPAAKDDLLEIEPALKVELFYLLSEDTSIFLENEVQYKVEYYSEIGKTDNKWIFERTESWIFFDNIGESSGSLQVGRQNYEDERQWWWDEQLDSIRLHYDGVGLHSEIAVAQELAPSSTEEGRIEPKHKDIFRILSHTAWNLNDALRQDDALRLDLFGLYQNDHSSQPKVGDTVSPYEEDERDADLLWYGARVSGEVESGDRGEFEYWVDIAGLTGKEKLLAFEETDDGRRVVDEIISRDVSGWGFDTGITWHTGILNNMAMTLGYAWGSGDRNPEDEKNRSFRQTGFNEGDKRFQYYGELLNPDLSNLHIVTVSAGFPLGKSSFIDFIYHRYRQDYPALFLWESDLEAEPEGISKAIGEEWDIALTVEEWDDIEIESSVAIFTAGDAFGTLSGETAYRINFAINYLF